MTFRKSAIPSLSGRRFGKLVAVRYAGQAPDSTAHRWECLCDCGNTAVVLQKNLLSTNTVSCGCWNSVAIGFRSRKHGMHGTRTYNAWLSLRARCLIKTNTSYPNYGGRGISVCERWASFEAFLADMGVAPTESHSIDRIDNYGNYEPSNCRWATRKEQDANKRKRSYLPK